MSRAGRLARTAARLAEASLDAAAERSVIGLGRTASRQLGDGGQFFGREP
jgi:hypothetical protein